jgi:hypothetical protein
MAALMGAGAFAVHQLRFALAAGGESGGARSFGGHAYLVPLGPILAGLLLIVFAVALARLARGAHEPVPRIRRLWAGASVSLLAVYCMQEMTEGMLTPGHPGGVEGAIGHGGWIALPLAVAIGLAIALIMRGAAAASALAAARSPWRAPVAAAAVRTLLPPWSQRRMLLCARHLAARGPPALSA